MFGNIFLRQKFAADIVGGLVSQRDMGGVWGVFEGTVCILLCERRLSIGGRHNSDVNLTQI